MSRIVQSIAQLIGGTPLLDLSDLAPGDIELYGKCEFLNPGGSVKDRPIAEMLDRAEERGDVVPGATIIEASSGNTGIALAMLCAERGYDCVVVMPEDMSIERRNLMRSYGARIELTAKERGMGGSMARMRQIAERLRAKGRPVFLTEQFDNLDNAAAHERTTGPEILEAMGGRLDIFVAGVGTGGTLTGVSRALRRLLPNLRSVGVEPERARAFAGGAFHPHRIQGIGAGFIPSIVDHAAIDEVVPVTDEDALDAAAMMRHRGVLVGPSSGANIAVSLREAQRAPAGTRIVTILCDTGERYLA